MKILWTSYVEAKSLYACKSFSKATMNKIDADTYEITGKEDWLKMIDTGYKKAFSNKYPKKGTMESKWKSIPLFPSERAVARSLLQVVLIITGKGEKYGLNWRLSLTCGGLQKCSCSISQSFLTKYPC